MTSTVKVYGIDPELQIEGATQQFIYDEVDQRVFLVQKLQFTPAMNMQGSIAFDQESNYGWGYRWLTNVVGEDGTEGNDISLYYYTLHEFPGVPLLTFQKDKATFNLPVQIKGEGDSAITLGGDGGISAAAINVMDGDNAAITLQKEGATFSTPLKVKSGDNDIVTFQEGGITLNSQTKVTAEPTEDSDVATKGYVDKGIEGKVKMPSGYAPTENGSIATKLYVDQNKGDKLYNHVLTCDFNYEMEEISHKPLVGRYSFSLILPNADRLFDPDDITSFMYFWDNLCKFLQRHGLNTNVWYPASGGCVRNNTEFFSIVGIGGKHTPEGDSLPILGYSQTSKAVVLEAAGKVQLNFFEAIIPLSEPFTVG